MVTQWFQIGYENLQKGCEMFQIITLWLQNGNEILQNGYKLVRKWL